VNVQTTQCNQFNNIKAAKLHDFASQVDHKMQLETNVQTRCNQFNNIKLVLTHMILLLELITRCSLKFLRVNPNSDSPSTYICQINK
jgi:hypothetical protein